MAIYSRSSIQNTYYRRFWIWKNKCIIKFSKPDIDKIYLYANDPYEEKCQHLINKCQKVGIDHFNDPRAFMEYSNDMQDVYKNIEKYNPGKKRKVLIVLDDIISDMINNKKLNSIVTELFTRGRNLILECQKMLD